MKTTASFPLAVLAASVAAVMHPAPTLAQSALEEVVVTARKRAETLEESPVSVRAHPISVLLV